MTLEEFITKWDGKYCEVSGSGNALNQCVDLANAYIREVLGFPIIEWANAIDFPSKAGDNYNYILNTPTGVPQKGDLVIWKPSPGHIAVYLDGNADTFRSFDENFPLNSVSHIQSHNYTNVLGWLRPKNLPSTPSGGTVNPMDQYETNGVKLLEAYRTTRVQGPEGNWEGYANAIIGNDKARPGLDASVQSLGQQLGTLNTILQTKDDAITSMKDQIGKLQTALTTAGATVITVVKDPVFKKPLANLFYSLAKSIEG